MKTHGRAAGTGPELYPILLGPVYKDYIWGGTRIPVIFHREPQHGICAESWEVADRPEGMSIVTNGRQAGTSLHELTVRMGADLVGMAAQSDVFPLLIKIIDARQKLSVQVHPDDRTAARYGGEPKTEMWYVLDADRDAKVFCGLAHGTDRRGFEQALKDGRLEDVLQPVPAEKGNVIFIPGGRVHAIGEGCLLLEVQQNSNTTYRVYDWGRVGTDGKPRELHLKQAFQSINWHDRTRLARPPRQIKATGANMWWELLECPHFHLKRGDLTEAEVVENDGQSFHVLFTVSGRVVIEADGTGETTGPGTSCLLPAALPSYRLTPVTKSAGVILISLV